MEIVQEKEYLIKLSGSDILDITGLTEKSSKEQKEKILKKIEAQIIEQVK